MISTEPAAESVELFRAEGDEFGEALALSILSLCCMSVSPPQLRRAVAGQREALELPAVRANPTFLAVLLTGLGRVLFLGGDPAGALAAFEESNDVAVRAGDLFAESVAVTQVGWARLALGDPHPHAFLRALEIATSLDNVGGIAFAFEGLAATARHDRRRRAGGNAARRCGEPAFANRPRWTSASTARTSPSSTRSSRATGRPTSRLRARRVTGCRDMPP